MLVVLLCICLLQDYTYLHFILSYEIFNAVTDQALDLRVFEAMPGISALVRADVPRFTVLAVTDELLQVTGMTREYLLNKGHFESFPGSPQDRDFTGEKNMRASYEAVMTHKKPHQLPVQRYDLPDGKGGFTERYWQIHNRPVLDDDGTVAYIIHTAVDITEKVTVKKREEAIKEIEKGYHLLMQAPVAVCIVKGPDYRVELANDDMLHLLGRLPDIVGKPIQEALPEAKMQGLIGILDTVRKTGQPYYVSDFPASLIINGVREPRYFDLLFKLYFHNPANAADTSIFCVANNVTEEVLSRQKVKESQEELRLAVEIAELGTFRVDVQTNTATYSQRIIDWFGLSRQGEDMDAIFGVIDPEDQQRVRQVIGKTLQSEAQSRHDVTYKIKNAKEGSTQYLRSIGKALYSAGKPYLILGTIHDITPQILYQQQIEESELELQKKVLERTIELEEMNKELKRSNANLEEFAYAASHDMKEPIRKIHFFADRLKQELHEKLDESQERLFDRMEKAAQRMGTLIDDLLLYSHISRGAVIEEVVDLNQKVAVVLDDLDLEIGEKKAKITVGPLPVIKGNRRQLQQLFQNIIGNALKYSKPGVPPEVQIDATKGKGKDLAPQLVGEEGEKQFHLLQVKDNGIGFNPENADRIFNMFTRLHGNAEYRGTGIGLSIVRKVAENHRGYVWAESVPGEGAVFNVLLPAE